MDVLGLFWIPDFLIWMIVFIVGLYVYGTWPFTRLASLGYKGPKPKPFFGNIDLLNGSGHFGAWYLTGKQQHGKVYAMYEGRQPSIIVFDTDTLKQILVKQFSNFTDRQDMFFRGEVMGQSIIDVKGAQWKRIRVLFSTFFTTGKLKRNFHLLTECVKNLIAKCDKIAESGTDMDAKDVMGPYTLDVIGLTGFGLHVDSQIDHNREFFQTMKDVVNSVNHGTWMTWLGFFVPAVVPFLERLGLELWPSGSMKTFSDLTKVLMEERRKSKKIQPDFIQSLIKAYDFGIESQADGIGLDTSDKGKTLSHAEIVAQVIFFFGAGYDTVLTAVSFLLFNLANNPDCQEKLVNEIDDIMEDQNITYENLQQMTYLNMCLEESLRLFPPALRTDRRCLNDITINGYFIPKDTMITVPIYGLHHDPEHWTDPEKFDPERFSEENKKTIDTYSYMPFGMGPRNCVGMRLAQIEVKMAVIAVVKHFKIRVSKRTKLPVKLTGLLFPNAEGGLWLHFEKRSKI